MRKKTQEQTANKKPTLHDLMETGKFAYNANVVWLLYPREAKEASLPTLDLTLKYEKNKVSDFKGEQQIIFTRATGTLKEWSISSSPASPFNDGGTLD